MYSRADVLTYLFSLCEIHVSTSARQHANSSTMQAAVLVRTGNPDKAYEIQERPMPKPQPHEAVIQVEAFGLNFADVLARRGLYPDAPPLPAVMGYDVVGRIHELGSEVTDLQVGQRVMALTRFGGYAEYAATDARGIAPIPENTPVGEAVALATQYGTAWFCAREMTNLHEGEHVLIQAAAGGVGTALVQLAKHSGCTIYGTASTHKQDYLREMGVDYPIGYRTTDFYEVIKEIRGDKGLDVVFDSLGGKYLKNGYKLLGSGGRMVNYGAADMATGGKKSIFRMLRVAMSFGIYSPINYVSTSRGMLGVNMLRIADDRPEALKRALTGVVDFYEKGIFKPKVGGTFKVTQLAEAHDFLESRQSIGKIVVEW